MEIVVRTYRPSLVQVFGIKGYDVDENGNQLYPYMTREDAQAYIDYLQDKDDNKGEQILTQ